VKTVVTALSFFLHAPKPKAAKAAKMSSVTKTREGVLFFMTAPEQDYNYNIKPGIKGIGKEGVKSRYTFPADLQRFCEVFAFY
jgi:hypothetical protein